MIKLPIKPWTPPIPVIDPKPPKPQEPEKPSSGGSHSGGGTSPGTGVSVPDIPSLESLFEAMLSHYLPETVEFTPLDEDVLSETIRNWLRPAYEQAIQNRREQTDRINAELDADAWSRGMGQSTYLSDVKERQYRGEQRDVDALESGYASELAGHLYDAMKEQQKMQIDVDRFNAEQINHAREQAMDAAQALYKAFLSGAGGGGGGSHGGGSANADESEDTEESLLSLLLAGSENAHKSDYRTIANMVARMAPAERARLYNRDDPKYLALRSEILWSIGAGAFSELMGRYPGA
ncbi:MAG: hypothetical protein II049_00935 [Clostridia bacterium]|nr:hypothetical protein [Clostridia bacterium]